LVLILQAIAPFLGSVFRSQKLTKSLYISGVSSQVLMIILTLMLGYVWGINGVIWAKIAVPVYSLGLSVFLWKKEVGRKI
jgi:O-antigen/teichoic acid export membrane protein